MKPILKLFIFFICCVLSKNGYAQLIWGSPYYDNVVIMPDGLGYDDAKGSDTYYTINGVRHKAIDGKHLNINFLSRGRMWCEALTSYPDSMLIEVYADGYVPFKYMFRKEEMTKTIHTLRLNGQIKSLIVELIKKDTTLYYNLSILGDDRIELFGKDGIITIDGSAYRESVDDTPADILSRIKGFEVKQIGKRESGFEFVDDYKLFYKGIQIRRNYVNGSDGFLEKQLYRIQRNK